MKWIKASERSPEPKPEMDNNREYSFHCRHDGKRVVLYFWSFNWWGERYDGEIYGVSEKVFNQLEWLDESHPEQGEQGRIKQLEEGIGKFIQWMKEKRPHVSGLGAPISILESLIEGIEFYWQPKLSSPPPEGQDEIMREFINQVTKFPININELSKSYLLIKK